MSYKVHIGAYRWKYFNTLEEARDYCSAVFDRTRVVLSIVSIRHK